MTMTIIRLYYVTGTVFILLTIILSMISMLSIESIIIFALAGILLLAIGFMQHMILLHEKLQQLKTLQTNTNPHHIIFLQEIQL